MEKNYNSYRKKLTLPEYGRHVQDMVEYLMLTEDRELRNRQARAVISVMGDINSSIRDSVDFTQKLWDHLYIMSDFQLDVDAPYPMPDPNTANPVPVKMPYPRKGGARKHYGKNVQLMIRSLEGIDDRSEVDPVLENIARFMRAKSYEYNQDHPNNELIIKDIKAMSESGIEVDETAINNLKSDYKQTFLAHPKKNGHQNKNGKKHKKRPQQQR